jgi:ATP synthase protein I
MAEPPAGPDPSFEERLRAARVKSGLEAVPPEKAGGLGWAERPLAMGFRVAGELVAAMLVAVAIGWSLDHWLGTTPWLLMLFVVLGAAAGVLNVWRLFKPRHDEVPRSNPGPGDGKEL